MPTLKNAHAGHEVLLTARDELVVRSVMRHGLMTRGQIQRLHFRSNGQLVSAQAVCRRLKLLTERGFLSRTRLPSMSGSGQFVYRPGQRATSEDGASSTGTGRGRRRRRITSVTAVAHNLETVEFYIALVEAVRKAAGSVVHWLGEAEVGCRFQHQGRRLLFTPDAYCLWGLDGEEGAFFLEWDRGTESMTRIGEKLARYEAYYGLRAYRDHLGEEGLSPRILFVVPDQRRQRKLTSCAARRLAKGEWPSLPTVLVATAEEAMQEPLGRVWHRPDRDTPMRFVD